MIKEIIDFNRPTCSELEGHAGGGPDVGRGAVAGA